MARAVGTLLIALVLCASAFALAHAGGRRALNELEIIRELGDDVVPPAAAQTPRGGVIPPGDIAPAAPGGEGGGEDGGGSSVGDILWFVLKWANEARADDRPKDH